MITTSQLYLKNYMKSTLPFEQFGQASAKEVQETHKEAQLLASFKWPVCNDEMTINQIATTVMNRWNWNQRRKLIMESRSQSIQMLEDRERLKTSENSTAVPGRPRE